MPVQQMIKKLNHLKPLSHAFRNYILANAVPSRYHRAEQISFRRAGPNLLFYIVYGTARGIHLVNGKETTIWFSTQDHFIMAAFKTSGSQFLTQIEFLTPSLVIPLDFSLMAQACQLFPEAGILFNSIIAEQLEEANFRELLLRMPYRDRYLLSLTQFPFLLSDCRGDIWASYLDISLSALGRIKKGEARRKTTRVK
jgi:hypothetical protein